MLSLLQWYTLKDVKSGKVHLILEWVPTVSHSVRLDQVGPYPLHAASWSTSFSLTVVTRPSFKHGPWSVSSLWYFSVESHSNTQTTLFTFQHIYLAVLHVADTAASGSPVLSEQSRPRCCPALCPYPESTFITCKSSALVWTHCKKNIITPHMIKIWLPASGLIVKEEWKGTQSRSRACSGWNDLQNPSEPLSSVLLSVCYSSSYCEGSYIIFSWSLLKLCDRTTSPQWNETFHFLVHNPKHQMLVVKVRFF